MNSTTQQYDFVAPFVPAADTLDGLLQAAELDNDLIVNIQIWDGARPGYTVELLWDNQLVGDVRAIKKTEKPGDILTLLLDAKYLKIEGPHQLGFRAFNPLSEVSNDSPEIAIVIDRTAPGAALLASLSFPDVTLGETLTGIVSGYAGMTTGDVIQTLCNDIEGPSVSVLPDNLTTTPVSIRFERSFLQSLDSDQVVIGYQVTDRAGNTSIMSQLVNLTLQV
ncbi:MAG: Uncharacterized protein JWQ69_394 [Pseudomonas sp.]|nr:Uncharacterized protein [Pseudomonas sp.]